ncbi:Peptide chain release factor 2 [Rickettsiales endosymbiont of Paramecium tredecaurelia]|nr:Peptide chain release factor 2 [Candidatus Sarmatiella mevalonica]
MKNLAEQVKAFEIQTLFKDSADLCDCFVELNAGAGGTESHDWVSMMLRMYMRFAQRLGYKVEIVDALDGEEAGVKSCTLHIKGSYAYGWFKTESGVHRLVRISPFNAAGKRMTSFASAWVYPDNAEQIDVCIEEKDLRIDTFRSSGAGGQHVNTTDSAVRITHIPTNIVVQSQSDRSQHKNKATCLKMLKAKLYELEMRNRNENLAQENAAKTDNSWGHQIRSYVLQPYQLVKDLRTQHQTSDTRSVLDGDLNAFALASLSHTPNNSETK